MSPCESYVYLVMWPFPSVVDASMRVAGSYVYEVTELSGAVIWVTYPLESYWYFQRFPRPSVSVVVAGTYVRVIFAASAVALVAQLPALESVPGELPVLSFTAAGSVFV